MDLKKRVGALRTCGNHPMEGWLRRAERHTMASADVDTATTDVASVILLILLAAGDSVVGRVIAVPVADDGAAISSSDYYYQVYCTRYSIPGIRNAEPDFSRNFLVSLPCCRKRWNKFQFVVPTYLVRMYVRTYVRNLT